MVTEMILGEQKVKNRRRKKILLLSNHFITIYNFRKELVDSLVKEGHDVYISIPKSEDNIILEKMGCKIIETQVDRRGLNPIKDIKLILNYIKIMKLVQPDIIFSYTIKPNIYGSIASNFTGFRQINNITGLGGTFLKTSILGEIAKYLYKISVKKSYKVFFQNNGDLDLFLTNNMLNDNFSLIPGSGVNLKKFEVEEYPSSKEINFIFVGRIMSIKGIDDYLTTAKTIKEKHVNVNFYVAGFIEEEKYKLIIEDYEKREIIKYIGFQNDIKPWIKKSHCVILPSIGGEGIPNVLLEFAAMGRVCIATSIHGSKDVIEDCVTGYLFEPNSSDSLIDKVNQFLNLSHNEKIKMGLSGREKIEREFDRNIIINKYMDEVLKLK